MKYDDVEIKFTIPFLCPDSIRPHLEKIFSGGEYDFRIALPGSPRIIDLGANYGAFSLWASHRWPGCLINAYEPHPDTYSTLKSNLAAYDNITAHNWGIGTPGMRIMYDGLYNSGENSFHHQMNNPGFTGRHLEVKDPLTLPEADIIKLDIEGCEGEVLFPLIESGRKFDFILMEVHSEELRRSLDQLLKDYVLIGSDVQHIAGRSVVKYIHQDIHRTLF